MDPLVESIVCPDAAPPADAMHTAHCAGGGALPAEQSTVPARLRCGVECGQCWWRHLPARRRHSAWPSPIGRCHGPCARRGPSVAPLCGSLWLPVALAGSPADCPTGLQLQTCLGGGHWLRHQLTASSDPRSRCLQIMPTRRPPTNSRCCSNLSALLCSLLCSPPIHRWQRCSAVYSAVKRRAAVQFSPAQLQALLGSQKSLPARRPAGLQQTVFPLSTPDAALLLFPFPTRPPRRNPDHPSDAPTTYCAVLLATTPRKSGVIG